MKNVNLRKKWTKIYVLVMVKSMGKNINVCPCLLKFLKTPNLGELI